MSEFIILAIPFIGTSLGSAMVFFLKKRIAPKFEKMLIFWSLVRNSVVLAVYLLFSVACFLTVHEHLRQGYRFRTLP